MPEYFVVTNSFAAPFFSDQGERFVEAESPHAALEKVAAEYKHPAGLYAAGLYASAEAYHKNAEPLARWLCNHEIAKQERTPKSGGYGYLGHGPGDFEIDGVRFTVENPMEGKIVAAESRPVEKS